MDDAWYSDLIRCDLPTFIGKTFHTVDPGTTYLPNWHIRLIAEYLEAARKSEITRLIINVPPRSLKSVSVSVAWPAWLLGHDPQSRIIAASYAASLSIKHALDCRLLVTRPWYQALFPDMRIVRDQNEKHKFLTTKRGFRLASSVGGSITGEGGNFLIVDDPLNPAQAMNATWRDATNRWFDHTLVSRLDNKRSGVIVVVMQRLHANDLTGHLLERGGWEHLCLPAIAPSLIVHRFGRIFRERKMGELLHPGREDEVLIARAKLELGSDAFEAQYQQAPVSDNGVMVRPEWIGKYRTAPPLFERKVQSWDTAIKTGKENDPSVCLTFGEVDGKSYLLDVHSSRYEYPDLKRRFYAIAEQWKPEAILVEDKASGQQLLQDAGRDASLPVIGIKPKFDKLTRFSQVVAMLEAGRLVLPENAPWLAEFKAELFTFPNCKHDDQIDALSQYLEWLRGSAWYKLRIRRI